MKLFKSKAFIICLSVAIILTLIPTMLAAFGGMDLLRSFAGTVAKPFSLAGSKVAEAFNGFVDVFANYDELKEENEELRQELEEYKDKEYEEQLLREQNDWLKGYINFHSSNPSFKLTDAKIVSREAGNYGTVITLNKGTAHSIKKNMPVITADGLLGYVSEVSLDWCKVTTVIEAKNSIGVYSERQGLQGILTGSVELREAGLCKMTFIDSADGIQIGDKIYTSGGSKSIYPADLYIGSVSEIKIDEMTGEAVATVTPEIDFTKLSDISDVMIICGYSGEK
jgi:rod shape-determining protein MreC